MACSFCDRLFSDIRRHKQASRKKNPENQRFPGFSLLIVKSFFHLAHILKQRIYKDCRQFCYQRATYSVLFNITIHY